MNMWFQICEVKAHLSIPYSKKVHKLKTDFFSSIFLTSLLSACHFEVSPQNRFKAFFLLRTLRLIS